MPHVAARRAVAGNRALGEVRPAAAADQGPPRARLPVRPDARGSDHRHRAQGDPQLPAAAGQPLPDPDQVPRRDPAALRRDARARVPDEGRVLVRRRRRRHDARATRRCTTPTRASSRGSASRSARSTPTPARSAASPRTSSRCSPTRARTRSPGRTASRIRGERRAGGGGRARDRRAPRRAEAMAKVPTPGSRRARRSAQLLGLPLARTRQVPDGRARRTNACTCCSCAATTWATR